MKYKKQIIMLMVILILFNSLSNPIKTNAAAVIPIGVSMGASAKAFLAFILASSAVGVTYTALEDAKAAFTSVSEMTNEQLADWIFGTPPPPQNQGPPEKFKWYDLLGLGLIGSAVYQQLKDFIDSFKGKFGEVQEGENTYQGSIIQQFNYTIEGHEYNIITFVDNGTNNTNKKWVALVNGKYLSYSTPNLTADNISYVSWIPTDVYVYGTAPNKYFAIKGKGRYSTGGKTYITTQIDIIIPYKGPISGDYIAPDTTTFNYYITNNAPILNPVQNPPPEKIYLPYLPTLDPDNDKIKEVYLPTGDKRIIYDGTEDEYYTDIVNNIDLEQLQHPDLKVSEITIIDGQIVIDIPIDNPFPYPDIQPNPDLPENEQNMIPWIQVIINWISQIRDTIYGIVVPPEGYEPPELNFEPLKNIVILDKFPFSLPWDYMNIIEKMSLARQAPFIEVDFPIEVSAVNWSQDVKFDIDFERFTPLANIMRIMLYLIFLIGLIILTRTFIGGA